MAKGTSVPEELGEPHGDHAEGGQDGVTQSQELPIQVTLPRAQN